MSDKQRKVLLYTIVVYIILSIIISIINSTFIFENIYYRNITSIMLSFIGIIILLEIHIQGFSFTQQQQNFQQNV